MKTLIAIMVVIGLDMSNWWFVAIVLMILLEGSI